jgi:propionate CoA-transferase
MQFKPIIEDPQPMDPAIFAARPMGLRERMLAMPLQQRFAYDPLLRMLFIDFRQLTIASERDIACIQAAVERRIGPLGHKVYAIVNYRDCRIEPAVQASYRRMVEALEERCYLGVTRYGLSDILEPDARRGGPGRPSPLDARVAAGWDDTERSLLALS